MEEKNEETTETLKKKLEHNKTMLKLAYDDMVFYDDEIRKSAKLIFSEKYVEGDSFGVPPITFIVDALVAYIFFLKEEEPPMDDNDTFNEIREEYEKLKIGKSGMFLT